MATALFSFSFALAGCQPAMSSPSTQAPPEGALTIVPNAFPLRFDWHNFQAICYNTIGCTVVYDHIYQVEDGPDEVSAPPRGSDYQQAWGSVEVGIRNFPAPAIVKWRSLDGQAHEAHVDIGEIFKDRKILHHVPEADIPEGWAHDLFVDIFLEVNDRTINVYMQSDVATKQEQTPGNKYSHHVTEMTLAWSRVY